MPSMPSVPVPSIVAPSLKVTVPVGVPEADVTVAVNVTGWPESDGFTEVPICVVVAAGQAPSRIETLFAP